MVGYTRDMATAHIEIGLTQGKVALIDVDDYLSVSQAKWHAVNVQSKPGGVPRWYARNDQRGYLHRFLLKYPTQLVDHVDGNTLDCRRNNLRQATPEQNAINSRRHHPSGHAGVHWNKRDKRWMAYIGGRAGVRKYLGTFTDKEAAVAARQLAEAEQEAYGCFLPH